VETRTLYQELGRSTVDLSGPDRGRTERTAAKETIDNDCFPSTLYAVVGRSTHAGADRGRTEVTKAGGETVDRDRHVPSGRSTLVGGDLYAVLGSCVSGDERGRTAVTESTETIDRDRSPLGARN
jgi:hypothetical protein